MNVLSAAIRLYQKSPVVNKAVRLSVHAHHKLTPGGARAACPYPGACSKTGLAAAQLMGMAALPGILSRMSACAPQGYDPDCNHAGVEELPCKSVGGCMPHPLDPTDGCTGTSHSGPAKGC